MDRSKWEYKKLGEVATFINGDRGVNYPSQTDFVEVGIPFVNAGHLTNNKIDFSSMNYITREKFDKLGSGKIKKGDILFCLRGSLGKKAIADNLEEGAIASSLVIIRPSKLNTNFLSYYLESPSIKREILRSNNGSSQPNLSAKSVSQFVVAFPSIEDQQRIVAELECLNEMIALKQEQLKEFDKLAQSILYDMFGDPITNEKGWDKVLMKQVIKVVGGYAFKSELFKDKGIPVLRIGNINTGEFRPINMVYWKEDDKLSRYAMYPGDLVVSLTGTVGKDDYGNVCILDNSYDKYYLNQRNAKLEILGNVEKLYLSRLLKIDEVKAKLTGTSRGVRQANISNRDIENLVIPLPPLALQQQFAEKIQAIEAQKELVKQSIAETQSLLDYTMDYYFNK